MTARKHGKKAHSGSPLPGEPEYLLVGTVRRPHGVHGEILMDVVTDFPERLTAGVRVFLGGAHTPVQIVSCRGHDRGLLIKFEGVETPEAAGLHRNQPVWVLAADRPPLPDGLYYHHQLLGCSVEDDKGRAIGTLTEILETGANDVYSVRTASGREVLLPAITGVVLEVHLDQRRILVHIPAGIGIDGPA